MAEPGTALASWLALGDRAISFSRPGLLHALWLAPLFLGVAAWRGARGRGTGTPATLWAASLLRTAAYALAVAAAAGASLVEVSREDRLAVVAAIDRSASIAAAERDWSGAFLDRLVGAMRPDDSLAVTAFARDAAILAAPGAPAPADPARAGVDDGATSLMAAIDSAASVAGARGGVIVLVTDGNQTTGDAVAAAEGARRRGLRIFPVVPPRGQAPLAIEDVSAPEVVREGRDVRLSVAVANRGDEPMDATLVARQGDRELGRVPLRIAPGRSVVDADVPAGSAGHYAITVALEGAPGVTSSRARRTAALTVLPPPRVLLVSRDAALEGLLRGAGLEVTRAATLAGTRTEDLARWQAVVFGEVSRDDLPGQAQQALDRYVRELGGGALFTAGRGLVGDPGLRGSALERLLPVRVRDQQKPKRKERAPIGLFLVLDRSSSMTYGVSDVRSKPSRMEYARGAALALVSQLGDDDLVGVVAFDTQPTLLAPLQALSANRTAVTDAIARLQPSGGTDFKEALEIASRQLVASGAATRHVILLSDGASIRPAAEHEPLVEALARSGITVTSIRIGDDKDSYALVEQIAKRTGGSFHLVTDAVSLPQLMIDDTRRMAGRERLRAPGPTPAPTPGEPEPFRPRAEAGAEALGGIGVGDLPVLREVAVVPLKPGAAAWLSTDRNGERVPVLAGWQNGLGRIAVFTADPSEEWQSWGEVRRFWSQLVRWVARPQASDELRLAMRSDDGRPVLAIDTFDAGSGGEIVVRATGRDGRVHEFTAVRRGARHFETTLPPLDTIERRVVVALRRGGATVFARDEWLPVAPAETTATAEDAEAEPNRALLGRLAEISGGALDAPLERILARVPAERRVAWPLADPLALAAILLALADIALRLAGRAFDRTGGAGGDG